MEKKVKYAALHLSVLCMALGVLLFAGAWAEGSMGQILPLCICVLLVGGIRRAWREIRRMEQLASRPRRVRVAEPAPAVRRKAADLRAA